MHESRRGSKRTSNEHMIFYVTRHPKHMEQPAAIACQVTLSRKVIASAVSVTLAASMVPITTSYADETDGQTNESVIQTISETANEEASLVADSISEDDDATEGDATESDGTDGTENAGTDGTEGTEGDDTSTEETDGTDGTDGEEEAVSDSIDVSQLVFGIEQDEDDPYRITFVVTEAEEGYETSDYTVQCYAVDEDATDLPFTIEVDENGENTNVVVFESSDNYELDLTAIYLVVNRASSDEDADALTASTDEDGNYLQVADTVVELDTTAPSVADGAAASGQIIEVGTTYYYQYTDDFSASFTVEDVADSGEVASGGVSVETSDATGLSISTIDNEDGTVTVNITAGSELENDSFDLTAVSVTYTDAAGNSGAATLAEILGVDTVLFDSTAPVLTVDLSDGAVVVADEDTTYYFGEGESITIRLSDANLSALMTAAESDEDLSEEVVATVTDSDGNVESITLGDLSDGELSTDDDGIPCVDYEWAASSDGSYTISLASDVVTLADLSGNDATYDGSDISAVFDATPPDVKIYTADSDDFTVLADSVELVAPSSVADSLWMFSFSNVAADDDAVQALVVVQVSDETSGVESVRIEDGYSSSWIDASSWTDGNDSAVLVATMESSDGTLYYVFSFTGTEGSFDLTSLQTISATDVAGNESEVSVAEALGVAENETVTVVVDNTAPEVEVTCSGASVDDYYYTDAVTTTITVVDDNFDADGTIVTVNGEEIELTWTGDGSGTYTATYTVSEDDDYEIVATSTDLAGNESDSVSTSFNIDATAPVVAIELVDAVSVIDGVSYYEGSVTATFTVTEYNFDDSEITVKLNNEEVDVSSLTWSEVEDEDDTYTATYTVSASEVTAGESYTFELSVEDPCGNTNSITSDTFVLIAEDSEPSVTVETDVAGVEDTNGSRHLSINDDQTVLFTVEDDNIAAMQTSCTDAVLTVVGADKTAEVTLADFTVSGSTATYELNLSEFSDGDYTLSYDFSGVTDPVGHYAVVSDEDAEADLAFTDNEFAFTVDTESIDVSVDGGMSYVEVEDVLYLASDTTQQIEITLADDNLDDLVAKAQADSDYDDVLVEISGSSDETEFSLSISDLTVEDGEATITVDSLGDLDDGSYTLDLTGLAEIADLAGNGADFSSPFDSETVEFVVDSVSPKVAITDNTTGTEDANKSKHLSVSADAQTVEIVVSDENADALFVKAASDDDEGFNVAIATVTGADDDTTYKTVYLSDLTAGEDGAYTYTLDLAGIDLSDGDYKLSLTPEAVEDLSGNACENLSNSELLFTVDTTKPTVEVDESGLDISAEDGSTYYLTGKTTSTFEVTVEDDNLDDLCANETTGAERLVTIYNKDTETEDVYTLAELWDGVLRNGDDLPDYISVTKTGSSTMTVNVTASDLDEAAYQVTVNRLTVTDLAGNKSGKRSWYPILVVDNTAPTLSVVRYGAYDNGSVNDMETVYGTTFFYGLSKGKAFVSLKVTDSNSAGTSVSGLKSIVGNSVSGVSSLSKSYDLDSLSTSDTARVTMSFSDDATITAGSVKITVADYCGNPATYALTYKNGTIVAYKDTTKVSNPSTLVDDTEAPTASIDFSSLSGYYSSGQSGTVTLSDTNLKSLIQYASSYESSSYNATVVTVKKTSNSGTTTTKTVSVADFLSGLSGTSSTYGLSFSDDADYVVSFTPKNVYDLSDNRCTASAKTVSFTVDTIDPDINVSWSSNSATNGNYYNSTRTATITVTEHNFDASLVNITATGGTVGSWSHNGDTHTITVTYSTDATCNLSVTMTDLAGNSASYTGEEFIVDTTAPTISFSGVSDKTAYSGTVAPVITFADNANFDSSSITYTLVGNKVGEVSYEAVQELIDNGAIVTFADFEHIIGVDDIYTLTATVTDLAGNTYEESITFSVNRFGSNFIVETPSGYDTENDGIDLGYLNETPEIVIREINVVGVEESAVTLTYDMETIVLQEQDSEDEAGYTVTDESADNDYGWQEYVYTISPKSFLAEDGESGADGVYTVIVSSTDEAGNLANSNDFYVGSSDERYDETDDNPGETDVSVSFTLDTTNPEVFGLSVVDGTVYKASGSYEVTVTATDNIGFDGDEGVTVLVGGSETDYTIDDDGVITFSVEEKPFTFQDISVEVVDYAGNTMTLADFEKGIKVTSNIIDLYWPYLIAGGVVVVVLVGLGIYFIVRKKKSDDDESANATPQTAGSGE